MNLVPFSYNQKEVRIIMDDAGDPWWVAKDVCDILCLSDNRVALRGLDEDEKGECKVPTLGGEQEMLTISESGLYTLIMRSNKPEAKPFRKWVTSEVLPTIRKTGGYSRFFENWAHRLTSGQAIQTTKEINKRRRKLTHLQRKEAYELSTV